MCESRGDGEGREGLGGGKLERKKKNLVKGSYRNDVLHGKRY